MKTCVICNTSRPNDDYRRGKKLPPFDECRACRVAANKSHAKPRKKPEYSKDHLITEEVPCMRCGAMVKVDVEPGTVIKHKFCDACRNRQREGESFEYRDSYSLRMDDLTFDLHCKTYRPGDRGFAQRAAEIMAHHAVTP